MAETEILPPRVWRFLIKQRGDPSADLFLRAAAVFALLCIPIVLLFPEAVTLVWLGVPSLPAKSPMSPFLPTAFEPLIMKAAKYKRAISVTAVATAAYM